MWQPSSKPFPHTRSTGTSPARPLVEGCVGTVGEQVARKFGARKRASQGQAAWGGFGTAAGGARVLRKSLASLGARHASRLAGMGLFVSPAYSLHMWGCCKLAMVENIAS